MNEQVVDEGSQRILIFGSVEVGVDGIDCVASRGDTKDTTRCDTVCEIELHRYLVLAACVARALEEANTAVRRGVRCPHRETLIALSEDAGSMAVHVCDIR